MTINIDYILRKMMGWCPNAGAIEARKSVQFDDLMVNAPGGGGELTHTTSRWWNKYHNIILMQSLIMSGIAVYFFILWGGYDSDYILKVIIYGMGLSISTGIAEWQRMNKAAAGYFKMLHETRIKKFIKYLLIIFTLIVISTGIYAFIFTKFQHGASFYSVDTGGSK
ncbi:MAG: DUF1673 family protein [Candidatus Methanoperedens sp.]|nr:DUF1673 family protein [Candidatus Methanoperedens sp.]CAG0954759.1 hypothetical protein METP1_00383 [Methanosarcinales archaeon]